MKDKKDCKIVQDLLPNYIEKLTTEESNKFIEEHLIECKECKKINDNMKKEIELDVKKSDKKEVNYIKKYNKKLRILKIILLAILAVFIIRTGRNMIILSSMTNKADKYISSTNYHQKMISYTGDTMNITDYYYKDGKSVIILQIIKEETRNKITKYDNGNGKYNEYVEYYNYYKGESKNIARINNNGVAMGVHTINFCEYNNNIFFLILKSILINIRTTECNGKECYLIDDYLLKDFGVYINKENGLIVRRNDYKKTEGLNGIMNIENEFGTVTDEIFIEPDISKYEIQN